MESHQEEIGRYKGQERYFLKALKGCQFPNAFSHGWTEMRYFCLVITGKNGFEYSTSWRLITINIRRNATIQQNEFAWIGDSAMASWGYTINNRIFNKSEL